MNKQIPFHLFHFLAEMCFLCCPCGKVNVEKSERISVLIPCYGKRDTVERAVKSAASQSLPPTQIVVLLMDNESKKKKTMLERIAPYVKCVESGQLNASAARNRLVELCTTEYFVFLDADDELSKNYLEETFKTDSSIVFAPPEISGIKKIYPDTLKNWFVTGNFTCLFHKTAFDELGGFDCNLGFGGEDTDLIMRLLLQGKWSVSMSCKTYFKYDNSGGLSKTQIFYASNLVALNKWLPIFKERYPYNAPCVNKNVCDFLDSIGDSVSEDDLAFFFNPRMKPNQTFQMFLATDNKIKCEGKLKFCL